MSFETPEIGRVHLVHNPGSTQPEKYKLLAHRLFDNGLDYDLVSTERDVEGMRANIEAADPMPRDIFAVMTGDGGANVFSEAAIAMGLENVVILQKGGKANDAATSHNGDADFFEILAKGVPARVHPIDMYVDAAGNSEKMYRATAYFGLNGTALASRALEEKRDEIKLLRDAGRELTAKSVEALTSLHAVAEAAPIVAELDGRTYSLADLTYIGISRMAREGKVHANPFSRDRFRRLATPAAGRVGLAARMSLLGAGMFFGDNIQRGTRVRVESVGGDEIALHINGEVKREDQPLSVPSGSHLTVLKSDKYINTLTVRQKQARRAAA